MLPEAAAVQAFYLGHVQVAFRDGLVLLQTSAGPARALVASEAQTQEKFEFGGKPSCELLSRLLGSRSGPLQRATRVYLKVF